MYLTQSKGDAMPDNTQETFKLDDPVRIEGKVTPEKAAAIIERMGQLLKEERAAYKHEPRIYYR